MQCPLLILQSFRNVLSNVSFRSIAVIRKNNNFVKTLRLRTTEKCYKNNERLRYKYPYVGICMCSLFHYFFPTFEKRESDDDLEAILDTLRQSKLLIQKEEFLEAEQMLHVALHQAQTIFNNKAITYVYDLMANLAFETDNYLKAETLFVTVLKRLIIDGILEHDLRIISISLKLAKIFEMKKEIEKSEQGYMFCIEHLQNHLKEDPEDKEAENMLLIAYGWYGQMLKNDRRYNEAYDYIFRSYNISRKIYGDEHEQTAVILNELGHTCYIQEKYTEAIKYFSSALEIGRKENMNELCEFLVNLGNAYIKKGLHDKAKKYCEEGRKIAKQKQDTDGLREANICVSFLDGVL